MAHAGPPVIPLAGPLPPGHLPPPLPGAVPGPGPGTGTGVVNPTGPGALTINIPPGNGGKGASDEQKQMMQLMMQLVREGGKQQKVLDIGNKVFTEKDKAHFLEAARKYRLLNGSRYYSSILKGWPTEFMGPLPDDIAVKLYDGPEEDVKQMDRAIDTILKVVKVFGALKDVKRLQKNDKTYTALAESKNAKKNDKSRRD